MWGRDSEAPAAGGYRESSLFGANWALALVRPGRRLKGLIAQKKINGGSKNIFMCMISNANSKVHIGSIGRAREK